METAIILFGDSLKAQARPWLEELGKSDGERLRKLLDFSRTPKIRLSDALASLFPGDDTQTGLANLTRLRNRLNEAGEGIGVRCEADTKKKSPPEEREVWFTGPDATVVRVTQFSKEVTADVEGRAFVPSKGIATTGSAMAAGKRLVRFFVSYAHEDKTLVESLMKALRTLFGASKGYELEFWTDHAIMVGEQWNGRILRAIADSDFGLFMVSPAFLGSRYIGENEIPPFVEGKDCKPVIPVGLATISLDRHDLKGLQEKQIFFKGQRTYDHMHRTVDKSDFAHLLFLEIEKRLDAWFAGTGDAGKAECGEDEETLGLQAGVPAVLRTSAGCPSEEEVQRWMRVPEETRHFQRTKGLAHHLAQRESLDPAKASLGEARDALDELEAWALRADGAPFFALLGEVGIGKTTTLKQFTRLLIEKRQKEPGKKYPLPIYIDLRDYVADAPGAVPTIEELLTSVIQRAWRVADRTITAADLLRLVRQENALIIFDGLDEKIVHLTQDRARDFIRTLWSVLPHAMLPRSGDLSSPRPSGKLLLSCRGHYFRDVWSQNAMLTGEHREGIDRSHYPAFCLLPFDELQIRNYLTSFLGDEKRANEAFDLIASIHNLRDLAERPYLLTLISGRLNELEALQMRGETVNAARLYDLVVRSWLSRDDGKHQIDPAHKRRLMEELAAALWRSGEKQWDVDRLEEWLDEFLHQNPAIASAYAGKNRSLLKEDLRTATFVLRPSTEDNHFRFAHTSLQEYFLAAYLVRALKEKADERWDMPMVSRETLEFLGQILRVETSRAALESLERVLGASCLPAACLAFQYWQEALKYGHPEPQPKHVNLSGACLDGQTIKGRSKDQLLNLRGASLRGMQLNRTRFENVDFTDADLNAMEARQALMLRVDAAGAKVVNADLAGLHWRGGSVEGADFTGTVLDLAEWQGVKGAARLGRALRSQCQPLTYAGHRGAVNACVWNPRGTALCSASNDGSLKIWDAATGKELLSLSGHGASVRCCAWSPDGTRLLSGAGDKKLKLWDAATGEELLTLSGHGDSVSCCAWSADGTRLLSGSNDNTLKLWDAATGKELLTLFGHGAEVNCCAWSPDGSRLLSGAWDKTLKLWNAATGKELLTLFGHGAEVNCCAWSPDGSRLLSGAADSTLKLWDAPTGRELMSLFGHGAEVNCCAWSPDGSRLLSGAWDKTLKLWNAATGKELMTLSGHGVDVKCCAWSPDGSRLLSGAEDHTLKLWDAATGKELMTLSGHGADVSCCAWSPDSSRLLSGWRDHTMKLWDAASGKEQLTLSGHGTEVSCCAWSPDGSRLLSGAGDNTLKLWDATTGKELLTLSGHGADVSCCAWSPDSSRLLSGAADHTLKLWDAATGKELMTLSEHGSYVSCCAWSPDGMRLLSGAADSTLKLWDAATGKELMTLSGHGACVSYCAWSPDGSRLLSGARDSTLKLWDAATGKELMTLSGHGADVSCCAWSPDGSRLLSASWDHTLKLWDAATGKELMTLSGHGACVSYCAWSPDGSRLLSGAGDNTLKVWDAATGRCIWTGHSLPEHQSAALNDTQILHATPEAWRWLGWEERDTKGRFIRRLPAEVFGPIPGMED